MRWPVPDLLQWLELHGQTSDEAYLDVIAACLILQELSLSDGESVPAEWAAIEHALVARFEVPEELAHEIRARAVRLRAHGTTVADASRFVRQSWSLDDRRRLVGAMRDVIWADGSLDPDEHKVAWSVAAALALPFEEVRGALLQD